MSALAEKRVLVLSLRARTSLLVSDTQGRKVPVDTGTAHGPLCEYCSARLHHGVHPAVAGARSCALILNPSAAGVAA